MKRLVYVLLSLVVVGLAATVVVAFLWPRRS